MVHGSFHNFSYSFFLLRKKLKKRKIAIEQKRRVRLGFYPLVKCIRSTMEQSLQTPKEWKILEKWAFRYSGFLQLDWHSHICHFFGYSLFEPVCSFAIAIILPGLTFLGFRIHLFIVKKRCTCCSLAKYGKNWAMSIEQANSEIKFFDYYLSSTPYANGSQIQWW